MELVAHGDGYGDSGYGDGSGYGAGDGYGSGSGDGYGDGSGDGDGFGDGDGGFGDGSGDGSGYDGYGSGSGYGDGYGDGAGFEIREQYLEALLLRYAEGQGVLAVWRSTEDGYPANGGDGLSVTVGTVQEIKGPLRLCSRQALHGTLHPWKWKGERWWVVKLHEPVQKDDDKMGSLKRTIIADLGKCPF